METRSFLTATWPGSAPERLEVATVASLARASSLAGVVSLDDPGGSYRGIPTGLYGPGTNAVPAELARLAEQAAARIIPRDSAGRPSANGRIGLIAIGPSTTRMAFGHFQSLIRSDPRVGPLIRTVNAGQDGVLAEEWAASGAPWKTAVDRVRAAGLAPSQVQAAWIEAPPQSNGRLGPFENATSAYAGMLTAIVRTAKRVFPNLQIAYLSSHFYGGYANRSRIVQEPYSYELGFGVRRVIQGQAVVDAGDASRHPAAEPVLLWGPYLWANGTSPRKSDGLTWLASDFWSDGVHLAGRGTFKIASRLREFLLNDPSSRGWFVRNPGPTIAS